MKRLFLYLLLLIFFRYSIELDEIEIESFYIVRGQGFVIHINAPNNFDDIKNCRFQFNGGPFITLNIKDLLKTHEMENGEIVAPYSRKICGIRVLKFSEASNDKIWTLEIENNLGKKLTKSYNVKMLPTVKYNFETKISEPAGKTITIRCSDPASTKGRFCRIINLDSGHSFDKCDISYIVRNETIFECHVLYWGSIVESKEKIIVKSLDQPYEKYSISLQEENESTITLTCKFPNKLFSCRAQLPNEENSLFIQNNLYSGRYSALDTSGSDGKCVLQILKPLAPNEKGIWRVFNDNKIGDVSEGCLFYVGDTKEKLIQEALSNANEKSVIEVLNSTFVQLECKMPFSVKNCYIRDPKHNVHSVSIFHKKSSTLGYCNFNSLPQIEGEWICGAVGENIQETIQKFEVVIKDQKGEAITKKVLASSGQGIELLCQTPLHIPINTCVFVDPKGKVYPSSDTQSDHQSRAKYFGDGLLQGHCGIQIKDLKDTDYGTWSCQFNDAKFDIDVEKIPHQIIGQASAIGLGVGLAAAVVFIVIASVIIYRKRKIRREMELQRTETISMSSRE